MERNLIYNFKVTKYEKQVIKSRTNKLKKKTRFTTSIIVAQALALYLQSLKAS